MSSLKAVAGRLRWPRRVQFGTSGGEWLIVVLLVASALLGSIAFWESTSFSSRSGDIRGTAEFAKVSDVQWLGGVQTRIAHQRRVVLECEAVRAERDELFSRYLRSPDESVLRSVVELELTSSGLAGQLGEPCETYDSELELDLARFDRMGERGAQTGRLEPLRSRPFDRGELWAVGATIASAFALLMLAFADSTVRPRRFRAWIGAALLLLVAGFSILVGAVTYVGEGWAMPLAVPVAVVCLSVVYMGIRQFGAGIERLLGRRSVSWYAEILGALTVVLLALAVMGYTSASIKERQARGQVDELTTESNQALQIGQESMLAVLEAAQLLEEGSATDSDAVVETLERTWSEEKHAWEVLLAEQREGTGDEGALGGDAVTLGCLADEIVLPWKSAAVQDSLPDAASIPEAVRDGHRVNPRTSWELVSTHSSLGSTVCTVQAAAIREEAGGFGQKASHHTVAIVVLGLAGLLFAFAGDSDRSRGTKPHVVGGCKPRNGGGSSLAGHGVVSGRA